MLSEILLRLPELSLHLFKSVSKHWLSLITSPNFTLSRKKIPKINPPAGLLILRGNQSNISINKSSFLRTAIVDVDEWSSLSVLSSFLDLGSSLPVSFTFSVNTIPGTSSEVTPCLEVLTGNDDPRSKKLLKTDNELYLSTSTIAVLGNDDLLIEILLRLLVLSLHLCKSIVNEHPVLKRTELPRTIHGKLLESGGSLLLLSMDDIDSQKFNVFEMKNGYSKWSIKYITNLDDIMMLSPITWRIYQLIPTFDKINNDDFQTVVSKRKSSKIGATNNNGSGATNNNGSGAIVGKVSTSAKDDPSKKQPAKKGCPHVPTSKLRVTLPV
nr:hypothetical protein [Tanacetum cinerariifolium]